MVLLFNLKVTINSINKGFLIMQTMYFSVTLHIKYCIIVKSPFVHKIHKI